ncbi:MAG: hypothetical protein ACE5G5_00250 [Candidatus Methylomirabilales bacterium]
MSQIARNKLNFIRGFFLGGLPILLAFVATSCQSQTTITTISVSYTEPSQSGDSTGTALCDLSHTNVYYSIDGSTAVKGPTIPATSPAGGGTILTSIVVSIPPGKETTVDVWVTATDRCGKESKESSHVQKTYNESQGRDKG